MRREPRFGIGIIWGTVPSGFPVFWVAVSGCIRNGYGTSPNLWVQKKLVKFWQCTQDTRLCPTELFWVFFSYSPFNLFRNLRDMALSQFRVKCILSSTVSSTFGCFSWNCCQFFLFLNVAIRLGGKNLSAMRTEFYLYFWLTMLISSYYEGKEFW